MKTIEANAAPKSDRRDHHPSSRSERLSPAASVGEKEQTQAAGNLAVQQLFRAGAIKAKLTISQPDDQYEQEADRVAEQVMRMPEPDVQRKPT